MHVTDVEMIQSILTIFQQKKEFAERIASRAKIFWEAADVQAIRNTLFDAADPMAKWKNTVNWQRRLSNKYNAREFAKKHGCRVARLYWKGSSLNEINFKHLPKQYVIRPTRGHTCTNVYLMNNGINLLDGRYYEHQELKSLLTYALQNGDTNEFLIEEFLTTEQGECKIPDDYKLFCFNGHVAGIAVINRTGRENGRVGFYNEYWQPIQKLNINTYQETASQQQPDCFDEIVHHAKLLSKSYELFVRVDFYATGKGAVFGEFTPTPSVGKGFTTFAEDLFITYWDNYCSGMV